MNTIIRKKLDNKIKTHIGKLNYNIGDLIYYKGKVYDNHDFYAKIIHYTRTSICIEILNKININGFYEFKSLKKPKIYNGLTRRSFFIINN